MTEEIRPLEPQSEEIQGLEAELESGLDQAIGAQHDKYTDILKQVLPYLGKDLDKIIFAQVMLALKLEGIIGKDLTPQDSKMIDIIKDAILSSDERTEAARLVAERILKNT